MERSHQITPKSVKDHNEFIHILTHLANSNTGLLQQSIEKQADPHLRSICIKLHQNIVKNNRNLEDFYDFMIERTSDKVKYLFPRSIKQLPL
jgi:hypothetical protein